jgi:hypothetical protein
MNMGDASGDSVSVDSGVGAAGEWLHPRAMQSTAAQTAHDSRRRFVNVINDGRDEDRDCREAARLAAVDGLEVH